MSRLFRGRAALDLVSVRLVLVCSAVFAICSFQNLSTDGLYRADSSTTTAVVVGGDELSSAALPHRFGLTVEFGFEDFDDDDFESETLSLESHYALADANEIPLNPPLFVGYKFGSGGILCGEGMGDVEEEPPEPCVLRQGLTGRIRHSDEIESRLLLAQDFGARVDRTPNGFIEQEASGDRGREWGFAQSIVTALTRDEWLKAGVETQSTGLTDRDAGNDPEHSAVVGPTIAGKPNCWSRLGVSPPLGVTETTLRAQVSRGLLNPLWRSHEPPSRGVRFHAKLMNRPHA